jgi:hypothetical protein
MSVPRQRPGWPVSVDTIADADPPRYAVALADTSPTEHAVVWERAAAGEPGVAACGRVVTIVAINSAKVVWPQEPLLACGLCAAATVRP